MDIGFVSHSHSARAFAGSFFTAALPSTARVHFKPGKFRVALRGEGAAAATANPRGLTATSAMGRVGVSRLCKRKIYGKLFF